MKKLSLTQMENLQGGKFWGGETTCSYKFEYETSRGDVCSYICTAKHYIFWINIDTVYLAEGTELFIPCP